MFKKKSKLGKVIKFEILRQVKKPSFWVAILAGPMLMLGIVGLNFLNTRSVQESIEAGKKSDDNTIVGLFNQSEYLKENFSKKGLEEIQKILMANGKEEQNRKVSKIKIFDSKEAGLEALKKKEIVAFFHVPAEFEQNFAIATYAPASKKIINNVSGKDIIKNVLRLIATKNVSNVQIAVISDKYHFVQQFIDIETGKEANPLGRAIIPLAILAILYLMIVVFGNRLFMTVVEEKESRVSEMLFTAVSARSLIIGKIISAMVVGFIIIACMIIPALSVLVIYRDNPQLRSILGSIELDPLVIAVNIALLLIAYFFLACIATIVGALTSTAREASQYGGILITGMMLPFFFMGAFTAETTTLATYALTVFPLSTPMALMFRNAFGNIPMQELVLGVVLLFGYAVAACFVAIKSFEKHALTFSMVKLNFAPKKIWKKTKKR